MGYFAGPMLGLFLLALLLRRVGPNAALTAVIVAFVAVAGHEIAVGRGALPSLGIWLCAAATLLTVAVGWLASWRWPTRDGENGPEH
jgi:EamA domain-containing membrane protein RarD